MVVGVERLASSLLLAWETLLGLFSKRNTTKLLTQFIKLQQIKENSKIWTYILNKQGLHSQVHIYKHQVPRICHGSNVENRLEYNLSHC